MTYARLTYARIAYSIECLLAYGLPVFVEQSLLYYRVRIYPFTTPADWRPHPLFALLSSVARRGGAQARGSPGAAGGSVPPRGPWRGER